MAERYDPDRSPETNLAVAAFALADAVRDGLESVAHRIEELSDTVNHYAGHGVSVVVNQEESPPEE